MQTVLAGSLAGCSAGCGHRPPSASAARVIPASWTAAPLALPASCSMKASPIATAPADPRCHVALADAAACRLADPRTGSGAGPRPAGQQTATAGRPMLTPKPSPSRCAFWPAARRASQIRAVGSGCDVIAAPRGLWLPTPNNPVKRPVLATYGLSPCPAQGINCDVSKAWQRREDGTWHCP